MMKFVVFASVIALAGGLRAAWYWPFGSEEEEGVSREEPRISELMEPASLLIDEAVDLAAEGKSAEAVESYRKALGELDRIERENPERAQSAEFATLRNKRAYVNAAIDTMLLTQVKSHERAVATTDTSALEKKLAEERAAKSPQPPKLSQPPQPPQPPKPPKPSKPSKLSEPAEPSSLRDRAMAAISAGKFEKAEALIEKMLKEKPNGAVGLNLRAVLMARQGKFSEAEAALDQAIQSNPKSHFAYYNMTWLLIQMHPDDTSAAKRYYETGRAMGGPADAELEAKLQ